MRILIVTTCWWPSLARFADLLRRQSCRVTVLAPRGHAMEAVGGITVVRHSAFRPIHALRQCVRSAAPDILIPGDDRAVAHMHALHASGDAAERGLVERSLGDPRSYGVVRSRLAFASLARALGLPVPEDRLLTSRRDVAEWTATRKAPFVLKADGAWSGHGVRVARHPQEAGAAWDDLGRGLSVSKALKRFVVNRDGYWLGDRRHTSGAVVSAQSYIEGHPGNIAFFAVQGELQSAICVETQASWGEVGPSTIVRVVDRPAMQDAAATLCGALGLSGFYGIDFMVDSQTKQATLIEMNPRVTALCNIRWDAARDLIGAAIRAWGGTPVPTDASCGGDGFAGTIAAARNTDLIAHFPLSWHWNNLDPRLAMCFQDIPADQPALVTAMLAPSWPDRPRLARLYAGLRRLVVRRAMHDEVRLAGALATAATATPAKGDRSEMPAGAVVAGGIEAEESIAGKRFFLKEEAKPFAV